MDWGWFEDEEKEICRVCKNEKNKHQKYDREGERLEDDERELKNFSFCQYCDRVTPTARLKNDEEEK